MVGGKKSDGAHPMDVLNPPTGSFMVFFNMSRMHCPSIIAFDSALNSSCIFPPQVDFRKTKFALLDKVEPAKGPIGAPESYIGKGKKPGDAPFLILKAAPDQLAQATFPLGVVSPAGVRVLVKGYAGTVKTNPTHTNGLPVNVGLGSCGQDKHDAGSAFWILGREHRGADPSSGIEGASPVLVDIADEGEKMEQFAILYNTNTLGDRLCMYDTYGWGEGSIP